MRRLSDGFTIVEVMIFVAVSAALMGSAWALISGRQEQVMFDQKMRDTQAKIQQWMSDVSTGITNGDPSTQWCLVNGNTPYIVNPTSAATQKNSSTYSPDCTFLGKAVQFYDDSTGSNTQSSTLYAYSVFGCRLTPCGSSGTQPTDMYSATPEPAIGGGKTISGVTYTWADLTEAFDLSPAYVKSVCGIPQTGGSCPNANSSRMIGFMNSFNTDNIFQPTSANGSEDLNMFLYGLNGNFAKAVSGNTVTKCLEGQSVPLPSQCDLSSGSHDPPYLQSYQFCLSDGNRSAQITISSANGVGATTKLDYIAC